MSAFQTSSKVATVSNATAQFSGSAKQMNTPADDVRPNVPHSYKHQMLYKDSSPSDVLSTPGRTQYVGTNYAHAHELPVSCRETAHFPSEMTSHDVTNLSDIGFHNPTGKQFNAGVFDMTRNFHAPTDLTMQNLENKRGPTLPYLKHMV